MSKKLYNSPKLEYTAVIYSGILCDSNKGAGVFDDNKNNPGSGGAPGAAPKRRIF